MDVAFQFSMFFKGYPPGTTVAMMRRKQEEEAELRSRHAGRETVQRWLEASEPFLYYFIGSDNDWTVQMKWQWHMILPRVKIAVRAVFWSQLMAIFGSNP